MRTIGMSDYTVGEDCFDELPGALAEYGATKVAIIGGKRALAAALPGIEAALAGTGVEILETRVYGTNSTRANIAKVVNSPACQQADVLIACGGGKALDTVKTAAIELKKIVFTVPTICSNCPPRPPLPLSTTTMDHSRAIRTLTDRHTSSSIPRS